MPIKVIKNLPAITKLAQENIFVMDTERAETQQIRPLHILLINLMPTKEVTETQILRALSNSPLQVNLTLLHTASRKSKNVDEEYLETFYRTFDEVKDECFDGLIITGAPVEHLPLKKWTIGKSLPKLSIGLRLMSFQPCIFVGGHRQVYTIAMA